MRWLTLALAGALLASAGCGNQSHSEPTPTIETRPPWPTPPAPSRDDTTFPIALWFRPESSPLAGPGSQGCEDACPAAAAPAAPSLSGTFDAWYEAAGVPVAWRGDLAAIAWCESRGNPAAVGDGGASLGLHQLWRGWFRPGEDPLDPVTNSAVAARVRALRGHFGGAGGWTCADLLGIA